MGVLDFIDSEIFTPVFNNDIPLLNNERVNRICEELRFTIKNGETVFVYGDYDVDGFFATQVWVEVFSLLGAKPPVLFNYVSRTHKLDRNIIPQVKATNARLVIICDTGSSVEDFAILGILEMEGYIPIVIDHHVFQGNYQEMSERRLLFNSYEEQNYLDNCKVSGAYASLLVAKVLCDKYMHASLSYNAKVFALGSMYSDMVDMSSSVARALYNNVAMTRAKGPLLLNGLNKWNYYISRRFFSFIVAPKINGCFRLERFNLLNKVLRENDKFKMNDLCEELNKVHEEAKNVSSLVHLFDRKRVGEFVLCTHTMTLESRALFIGNFTGVIANKIAQEEMAAVVVVVKDYDGYRGSFRDYFNRRMLQTFELFCMAGGHPPAFGLSFTDISEFERHLKYISTLDVVTNNKAFITISSGVIESQEDLDALALYNEYMNEKPSIVVSHRCHDLKLIRSTKYNNYYQVGLPCTYNVMTSRRLREGDSILIEPAICRGVELRERE